MKKLLILTIFSLLGTLNVSAQKDQTIFGKHGVCLTGMWGGSTKTLSTFTDKYDTNKNGYFVFEISKRVLVGWESLSGDFVAPNSGLIHLNSHGFTFGYSPFAHKAIHPIFNIYGSKGTLEGDEITNHKVMIWQPSMDLEINVLRWFKIGVNAGYRFVNNSIVPDANDEYLSGPFAGIKLKFGWSWRS